MNTASNHAAVLGIGLVHNRGDYNEFVHGFYDGAPPLPVEPAPASTQKLRQTLPQLPLRRVPHYARMGLQAATDALNAHASPIDLAHTALVIGTAHAGVAMGLDFMDSVLDGGPRLSSPTSFSHAVNNMGAGLLSLHLGIQGPCCTLTQFALSFAGALQVACTLLRAGTTSHVLVGSIEEADARFSRACGQYITADGVPITEGAVFLLLGTEEGAYPHIAPSWVANDTKPHIMAGKHASYYGATPLAHALEVALCLAQSPQHEPVYIGCEDAVTHKHACIELQ